MNATKSLSATPWDFKTRALVLGSIYACGFLAGIYLQYSIFGSVRPAYYYIGRFGGPSFAQAAAFIPVVLTLAAYCFRLWGAAYLSSGVVWNPKVVSAGLLTSGPYRYVRNPLYLANVLLAIGIGMMGPPLTLTIIVAAVVAFALRLISIEERYLSQVYGRAYREYREQVPRLIPRLTPAPVEASDRPPRWADGFWSEIYHLAFVAAALYNALFTWPRPTWAVWIIFVSALAAQMVARRFAAGKSPATA